MTQSVSFRITRTAEDVAQTLNALSQRLIKLENRLESLELQLERQSSEVNSMPADEMERLDGVDRLQWVDQSSSVMSSEQDLAA